MGLAYLFQSYFLLIFSLNSFHKSACHGLKMGVPHCRLARLRVQAGTVRNPGERDEVNQNKETGACFLSNSSGNFRWWQHVGTISVLFVQ